jgi:hypothetical protein
MYLGLSSRPSFSSTSMVTPAISGLFNGDALAAIAAAGITTVVGDNTWPTLLLNKDSPYHLLATTEVGVVCLCVFACCVCAFMYV